MSIGKLWAIAFISVLAEGCGGGGGGGNETGTAATYSFAAPKVNSQRIYAYSTVDSLNSTINQTVRDTITSVASDGSFTFVRDDPTGNSYDVNGTSYTTRTDLITENRSGQTLSDSYSAGGVPVTCKVAPHGAGPDYPVSVGQTWSLSYAVTCGTAVPTSYAEAGSVIGVEAVTVPAGTFSAVKTQSTSTSTDPSGTTRTESITTWRDIATAAVVKRIINVAYSGTPLLHGYPVTTVSTLQSQS